MVDDELLDVLDEVAELVAVQDNSIHRKACEKTGALFEDYVRANSSKLVQAGDAPMG